MSTVTYITDTNADPRTRYLVLDGYRETSEADDARVFGEYNVFDGGRDGIYNAIAAECEAWGLTDGYASVWETLTVLEEIGGNVERFLD